MQNEVEFGELKAEVRNLKEAVEALTKTVNELNSLRFKGAGAFWLATSLAGAGVISIIIQIVQWVGGR